MSLDEATAASRCDATIVIVGGGPHGLALLSALHERSLAFPADSDRRARDGFAAMRKVGSVCVIDPGAGFLSEWHARFDALGIQHLRSPALAHPKALEPHALVNFAMREGRTSEIVHAPPDGVGRRLPATDGMDSQHPLMLGLPSTALFKDFCSDVALQLPHRWLRGTAISVHKDERGTGRLCVQYAAAARRGTAAHGAAHGLETVTAGAVILATGPRGQPNIPEPFRPLVGSGRMTHTEHLWSARALGDLLARASPSPTACPRVLVVGGGLTAAQVALAAVARGSRVVLRSRRPLQTRAFDIAAEWLDQRHANRLRFDFFSASVGARKRLVKQAVTGGSVPEAYMRELRRVASTTDLLEVQTDAGMHHCTVGLDGGKVHARGEFDLVILATGVTTAPLHCPFYQQVQTAFGARTVDGFPCVDDALRWVPDEELFVMGANALLQLGPGALNLMGAMRGAQIVAAELHHLMWNTDRGCRALKAAFAANKYSALLDDADTDSMGTSDNDGSDES